MVDDSDLQPDDGAGRTLDIAVARPESTVPGGFSMADQGAVIVSDLLYDGLTEVDGNTKQLRSALARSWSGSADVSTWTFKLDDNRLAQANIDRDHIIKSFTEMMDAAADDLSTWTLLGDVESVEAGDEDLEVVFTLASPNGGFPWLLSGLSVSVVGPGGAPTGQFDVVTDDDLTLELKRLAHPDLELAPSVDRIVFHWTSNADAAYAQLTSGSVDAAVAPVGAIGDAKQRFGSTPPARSMSRFYVLNPTSATLSDPMLREALLLAVDQDSIAESQFAFPVHPTNGVIASTMAGYRQPVCGATCQYDPSVAVDTIGAYTARHGEIPSLRIAYTGQSQQTVAQSIGSDLGAVGVTAIVEELDMDTASRAMADGDIDIYAYGWVSAAGSVDAVVPALLRSDSPANTMGVASEIIDTHIDQALGFADDNLRWALLARAHDAALRDGVVMPLASAMGNFVQDPTVGEIIVRADGSLDLNS